MPELTNQALNFPESIPSIVYGILGLSITIATFLPALVYSYNKSLLKNLVEPVFETKKDIWERVISFIFTTDLLLTQSMLQVFFSALYGIIVFADFSLNLNNQTRIWFICLPIFIANSFHWYFSYFWSEKEINIVIGQKYLADYWRHRFFTKQAWQICSLINLLITSICIFTIFFIDVLSDPFVIKLEVTVFLISYLSIVLISYAISWLVPLVVYNPLTMEVKDYIEVFESKNDEE